MARPIKDIPMLNKEDAEKFVANLMANKDKPLRFNDKPLNTKLIREIAFASYANAKRDS